jgi:hypothetical protein
MAKLLAPDRPDRLQPTPSFKGPFKVLHAFGMIRFTREAVFIPGEIGAAGQLGGFFLYASLTTDSA